MFGLSNRFLNDQISSFTDDDEEDQASQLSSADLDNCVHYSISEDVKSFSPKITSLTLLKRGPILDAEKTLLQQIRLQLMDESSPYEEMHFYNSAFLAPKFKSHVKATGRAER